MRTFVFLVLLFLSLNAHSAIVGSDDRRLVPRDYVDPGTIAILRGADSVCTGTRVGPSFVITAAHCVYDDEAHVVKDGLTVMGGLHLAHNIKRAPRFHIKRVFILHSYQDEIKNYGYSNQAAALDLALIQVREYQGGANFSDRTQDYPLQFGTALGFQNLVFDVISYAADRDQATSQYYVNDCKYQGVVPYHVNSIYHDCDTHFASSGSALMSGGRIHAIHTSGSGDWNRAVLLKPEWESDIRKILNFEFENLQYFEAIAVDFPVYYSMDLINTCQRPVTTYVVYTNLQGQLKAFGPVEVAPGQLLLTHVQSSTPDYHVSAFTDDFRFIWEGETSYRINGVERDFIYVRGDAIGPYSDARVSFNCISR